MGRTGNMKRVVLFTGLPFDVGQDDGELVENLIAHDGETELRGGGGRLVMNQASADAVIANLEERGKVYPPVDINHSTIYQAPKGKESPSFGEVKKLTFRPGEGLFAHIGWTDKGREKVRSGEYRYPSPVLLCDIDTDEARELLSVAMTNTPATPNIPALAAMEKGDQLMDGLVRKLLQEDGGGAVATADQKMGELKAALEAKGAELGDGADFVAIINAALALIKGDAEKSEETPATAEETAVAASVRVKLGLAEGADNATVLKALSEVIQRPPVTDFKAVSERLEVLQDRQDARDCEELIEKALSDRKLNPANEKQMAWARANAKSDPEGFKVWMASTPDVLPPQGRTDAPAHTMDRDRTLVMKTACEEFDADKNAGRLTTKTAWVNDSLRRENMKVLTEKEDEQFVRAVA